MQTLLMVTPTLGKSVYLQETLRSVSALAEQGIRVRHLVVSPLSSGASFLGAEDCNEVEYIQEQKPVGMYAAINLAVSVADGGWDFLAYINDDDHICPDFIALCRRLAEDKALGIAYGEVSMINGQGHILAHLPIGHQPADLLCLIKHGIMPLAQPGLLITRACWELCGPFDESYKMAGDLEFIVRALSRGVAFSYVDRPVAQFRVWQQQLSKNEALGESERLRAVSQIPRVSGPSLAKLRFWAANWKHYLHRIRHHGFKSTRELYRHA